VAEARHKTQLLFAGPKASSTPKPAHPKGPLAQEVVHQDQPENQPLHPHPQCVNEKFNPVVRRISFCLLPTGGLVT
jgi:hypothetical protein